MKEVKKVEEPKKGPASAVALLKTYAEGINYSLEEIKKLKRRVGDGSGDAKLYGWRNGAIVEYTVPATDPRVLGTLP